MLENVKDWAEAIVALLLILAVFRKEIVKLFKKKGINNTASVFQRRIWEADKALNRCKNLMLNNFPVKEQKERRAFDMILYYAFTESKDYIRELLVRNHFIDMSEHEFSEYLKERPMDVIQSVSTIINRLYNDDDFSITRKELFEYNQNIVADCLGYIKEFFETCRTIEEGVA